MNWRKIGIDILGGSIITGVAVAIYAWAKGQYYQGRIDASEDMIVKTVDIMNKIEAEKKRRQEEEE